MKIMKALCILIFTVTVLFGSSEDSIFFNKGIDNSQKNSLKYQFLAPKSDSYTIVIATIDLNLTDPYEYFKKNNLTNVLAYTYGKKRRYARVLLGVFDNITNAKSMINKLPSNIKRNSPYISKISKLQQSYNKNLVNNKKDNNIKIDTKLKDDLIYISNTKNAKELKKEFLNENSKYYSLSIASIDLKNNTIEKYFKKNNIEDKALAHLYGKNKDKARVIYGLFKTRKEAMKAIKELNKVLQRNKPFAMKMAKFQSFYKKNLPKKVIKKKLVENKDQKKPIEVKHQIGMQMLIEDKHEDAKPVKKDKNLELKSKKYKDLYFFETKNNKISIKDEFLNNDSNFYTIDFGEIDLSKVSIKKFINKNGLKNNVLAYKYGDNNEYARVLYGAFETREASNDAIEKLNLPELGLRVVSIRNHQILYKIQHNQPIKDK